VTTALVTSTKLFYVEPVGTGIGDLWLVYRPTIYPGHSEPLSLAIPLWVGAMNTGDGFDYKFCVAVITRLFVPQTIRTTCRPFVPWTIRPTDLSYH